MKKDALGEMNVSKLMMLDKEWRLPYNEVKFFKPLIKSREELTLYISVICLQDSSLTSKKLVREIRGRDRKRIFEILDEN